MITPINKVEAKLFVAEMQLRLRLVCINEPRVITVSRPTLRPSEFKFIYKLMLATISNPRNEVKIGGIGMGYATPNGLRSLITVIRNKYDNCFRRTFIITAHGPSNNPMYKIHELAYLAIDSSVPGLSFKSKTSELIIA